jgi:pimeloyl-ACP methyl ester carboxylesterase
MTVKLIITKTVAITVCILTASACAEEHSKKMVDMGEYKVSCKIQGKGSPTVVIENAMGGTLLFWDLIQTDISQVTSVLTYDRPGNGDSEVSPYPRTNDWMAKELHTLLRNAYIQPPYILVGSSYGAFIIRTFAHAYPEEVAGMVLVEPVHEDLLPEMQKIRSDQEWKQYIDVMNQMAAQAPEGPRQEWEYYFTNSDAIRGVELPATIPITILTSTRYSDREKSMMYREEDIRNKVELHKQWIGDKSNIAHIMTDISGHNIAAREPHLVIDAIRSIIEQTQ